MSLPVIKFKDFQHILEEKGFKFKERTGTHLIYVNNENYQVVLPFAGKEVKPIMAKVILNRIKHNRLIKYSTSNIIRTKGGGKRQQTNNLYNRI